MLPAPCLQQCVRTSDSRLLSCASTCSRRLFFSMRILMNRSAALRLFAATASLALRVHTWGWMGWAIAHAQTPPPRDVAPEPQRAHASTHLRFLKQPVAKLGDLVALALQLQHRRLLGARHILAWSSGGRRRLSLTGEGAAHCVTAKSFPRLKQTHEAAQRLDSRTRVISNILCLFPSCRRATTPLPKRAAGTRCVGDPCNCDLGAACHGRAVSTRLNGVGVCARARALKAREPAAAACGPRRSRRDA